MWIYEWRLFRLLRKINFNEIWIIWRNGTYENYKMEVSKLISCERAKMYLL